jgi:hypothetical protein
MGESRAPLRRQSRLGEWLLIVAVVLSAVPIFWLALFTYNAVTNVPLFGFFKYYSVGYLVAAAGAWVGLGTAAAFSRKALRSRSLAGIRSPLMIAGLLAGLVGFAAIEVSVWSNPQLAFPPGFFVWPMLCFVAIGLLAPRLPRNP